MRQSLNTSNNTSKPLEITAREKGTEVSITQVQQELKRLIDLAGNNAHALADAKKLQAKLAQMVSEGRTTVQQGVLALIHAQKQLIMAENAGFGKDVLNIFTTPPAANDERFAQAA